MGAPRLATPGALPDGYRFHYADAYRGWPVQPLHGPHTLHGAFNDPREGGYHFGVNIPVDDSSCRSNARSARHVTPHLRGGERRHALHAAARDGEQLQ